MSETQIIALACYAMAAMVMLLVTQTKARVSWPGWLVPMSFAAPAVAWTCFAIAEQGLSGFWPVVTGSAWGLQLWFDRLLCVSAAFFLLQNRARAIGMKSEVWVLVIIFSGGIGLMLMLARTVYLERHAGRVRGC
jgi:hypothetical protein